MLAQLTNPEAVTVLALIMVGADGETKVGEISSMLNNPFFIEHISEKIGPPIEFIHKYNQARKKIGKSGLEKKAITVLKAAFPALRIRTVALLVIIAQADDNYDEDEKELVSRIAKSLNVNMEEVSAEIEKMSNPPLPVTTTKQEPSKPTVPAAPEENTEAPPEKTP